MPATPSGKHARAELLLNTDTLLPGQQAIAAVVVTIDDGYHAQSSQPLDPNLIPFEVTVRADGRINVFDSLYPLGEIEDFPALGGKLSVYADRVVTFIPFVVKDDATLGEVTIEATIRLQLCNDETCDAPMKLPLSTRVAIAAPGTPTKATHTELFGTFDANRWLHKHPTPSTTTQTAASVSDVGWVSFSDEALAAARKTGKPTIIDFTAAWCVNCHVVERLVYGDAATLSKLRRRGVTLMKADLTREDAPGSALLAKLNPSRSIPFTAVYLPGKDEPVGLSGIYNSGELFAALDHGRGTAWDFSKFPLAAQLGLAIGIGVLLNVVPCVLPVLPLKAMSFYEDAGHSRSRSMLNGGMFALGIVVTFGALAAFVISQNALWGKFISSPITAVVLSIVLLLAAAQSLGLFEFVLPRSVTNLEGKASGSTLAGNFFSGILIAVLSTPCTIGPFAGIIAAAITLGLPLGPVLLMFVGVGMALPWFVLSAFPEATRRFPRTGPWPLVVKQMTGFLLIATAIFFAAPLLPAEWRERALWWVIFACIAAAALFLMTRTIQLAPRVRPVAIATCVSALLVAGGLAMTLALTA